METVITSVSTHDNLTIKAVPFTHPTFSRESTAMSENGERDGKLCGMIGA
ncbi:hypothetical protein GCM10023213_06240 [Prosthecobacter algae]|uniref:Uncharacterized protein n=1 Tax=Prosthecobacter algae TaxID=1144682 RepID=A0ABP9P0W2_9BACT